MKRDDNATLHYNIALPVINTQLLSLSFLSRYITDVYILVLPGVKGVVGVWIVLVCGHGGNATWQ